MAGELTDVTPPVTLRCFVLHMHAAKLARFF
jgi:hypothetical protein